MKRIFKLFIAGSGFTLLMMTCTKDKDKVFSTLTSHVDLTESTLAADQASTTLVFSTDGGTTYQNFADIKTGQKFKVQILDRHLGHNLLAADFYSFDWSASDPKPTNATSDSPEFTMSSGDNKILVTVLDAHCSFEGSSWTGDWIGEEGPLSLNGAPAGNGSTDDIPITIDPGTPNGYFMDNFFNDGTGEIIHFTMSTSTTAKDQIITIPEQVAPLSGGITSGTGTYDQCRGLMTIDVKMVFGTDAYTWTYQLARP